MQKNRTGHNEGWKPDEGEFGDDSVCRFFGKNLEWYGCREQGDNENVQHEQQTHHVPYLRNPDCGWSVAVEEPGNNGGSDAGDNVEVQALKGHLHGDDPSAVEFVQNQFQKESKNLNSHKPSNRTSADEFHNRSPRREENHRNECWQEDNGEAWGN